MNTRALPKVFASFLIIASVAGAVLSFPRSAYAAGTQLVTNGSTQIGTFPSSLPNTSFRIDTSVTNSASVTVIAGGLVGSANATLSPTTGWSQIQNASVDDAFKTVAMGFSTSFNGTSYSTVYIGSNTYITFSAGSSVYSSLSASNPNKPGVHLAAADNSYQRVYTRTDSPGVFRVRYEGNNSTSGTVGSPTIVYEAVFYTGASYFDVHMGANSRAGGDATAPTITSVSSNKTNGTYKAGEVIDIDVTFSEAVTSTGNVTVTLETGATDRTCAFVVSNATTGTCNYTVQAGDTSSDLTVNTISGTIKDAALNTLTNFTPGTNLAANKALVIDTTAPTITSVSSDKANGSYKAGDVIDIDVTFSEAVTSTGNVTVTLETGVTDRTCTFTVSNATTGTCNYTVQASDASADLTVNTISGTIKDQVLNTMANFVPSTNLAANKALVIDNVLPTVTSVSSDKTNGSYKAGDVIDIDVNFSEAVTSTGNVTVTLETGTTDRTCAFTVTGSTQGTCNYTVQAGDTSADLTVNTISGTVNDAALNAVTNFVPSTNLAANKALVIDTVAPTLLNVSSDKANGTYAAGAVIDIDVTFSEAVTSTGNVTVTLETGATDRTCTFTVSAATTGTCNYTVQSDDASADLTVNSVTGTVRDAALNDISGTTPATNLAANKALVVDTTAPTITNVSSDKANGSYKPGDIIDIDVTFSEAVTSTGNVTVTLETGATDRTCTFVVSSATTGTCDYVVQSSDASADLTVNTISGTIKDAALNAVTNFVPSTNLAANKALVIDAVAPTVTGVTSSLANGSYKAGQLIPVQVTFSESVTVASGAPTLTLVTGSPATTAVTYSSGSPGATLTFDYTVASGNASADLDYASVGALALSGATIRDAAGNDAVLTLAAPGASSSLGANKALVIDNVVPTAVLTSTAPNPTNVSPIPVVATFTEVVTGFDVTDLVVTNGSAGSFVGSATNVYTFSITPTGQGAVTVYVPAAAGQDAAANQNAVSDTLSRTYDSVSPTVAITSGTASPTSASPIAFTATFSEAVTGFVLADITAVNAYVGNFAATSSTVYTFDVSPIAHPIDNVGVSISVSASKAQDAATNQNTASDSGAPYYFIYDDHDPTVALTSSEPDPTNNGTIAVTAQFNEGVTLFLAGDITANNGSVSNFTISSTSTYTFDVTPSSQGLVTVRVAAGVAIDLALLTNTVSNLLSRTYDTVAPTVSLTSSASSTTKYSPIPVVATFSSGVTGFVVGDLSLTNGSAGNFVSSSSTTYSFDVTPSGQGTVSVQVPAASATDQATNANVISNLLSRIFDSLAPTLTLPTPVTTPTNDTTPTFTVNSTEAGAVTYGGACSSGTASLSSGNTDITYSTLSQGTYNGCGLTVTDDAGNASALLAVSSFTIDTTAPTLTSSSLADASLAAGETTLATFTFSEAVTGFAAADVTSVPSGSLGSVSSSDGGTNWTATFTPTADVDDATNVMTVTMTGLTDIATNPGVGTADSSNYAVDTLRPTVSIGAPSASTTNGASVTYTVTYGGASSVTLADLNVTLNTTGTAAGSAAVSGSGLTTRTVTVSSITGTGTLGISLAAGTAVDAFGNSALGAGPGTTFIVDTTAPSVSSIVIADTSLAVGETSLVTFTFSEAVTGFANADLTAIQNGTLTTVSTSDSGTTWTATFTPTADLEDASNLITLAVTGVADAAGNAGVGTHDSPNYAIDTLRPTVVEVNSDKTNGTYETGEVIDIDVTFSEAVTSTGNVTVTLETGTTDRTCTFTVSAATTGTCDYTVQSGDVTSDLTVNDISGTIRDALLNAVTNFVPATNLAANKALAIVNTIPTIVSVSSDKPDGTYKAGEVIDIDVVFSENVTSTGNVTVTIETGATDRTCTFTISNATIGTCNYTVQSGDSSSDLDASATGTIKDSSLNPITDFTPATGLAAGKAIAIDSVAPTILNITSSSPDGRYGGGATVSVDVTFSEAVTSVGNVRVTLETGDVDQSCTFTVTASATGSCDYSVQTDDYSLDLTVATVEGDVNDAALNAMTNFTPATNLAANKEIVLLTSGSSAATIAAENAPLSVTVAMPNGGGSMNAGGRMTVTWNKTGMQFHYVSIQLSTNGGNSYPVAVASDVPDNGSYLWTIPADQPTTAQARVRVQFTSGGSVMVSDTSDSNFMIVGAAAPPTDPTPTPGTNPGGPTGPVPLTGPTGPKTPGTPPGTQPGTSPGTQPGTQPGPGTGAPVPDGTGLMPPSEPLTGLPRIGESGPAVESLKAFLAANGFPAGEGATFDAAALSALVQFQIEHTESGELGPNTLKFINDLFYRKSNACRRSFFGLVPPIRPLTRTLAPNDVHADVKVLQKFLNDNRFLLAARGAGAPGSETERFLTLTVRALAKFQAAHGLLSEKGSLGPKNLFFLEGLTENPSIFQCPSLVPPTVRLARDLKQGDRGADVRVLQRFLNDNGYALAASGPGSKGQETTNYFALTRVALARFQGAYGLTAENGAMGPLTRSFMNALIR
ncbi:MAG: Ig-like domain-containing protein [Patescibacteria group bacterium]